MNDTNRILNFLSPVYFGFDPEVHGSYAYGIEKLSDVLEDFKKNAESHWEETETLYRQAQGEPNYPAYMALEDEGKFVIFTSRCQDTGDLVGHLAFYVYESMHTIKRMEAREDAFFVAKDHRGGRLAVRLYDYAEKCLRKMGVHQMTMSSKEPAGGPSLDKFLRRKGYNPVAVGYFKFLTEEKSDGNV